MIGEPEILETAPQRLACVHLEIPREDIRHVMDPGLSEIMRALADQRIEPSGAWMTHHFRMEPGIFDFEICVPVEAPVKAVGRVYPAERPAMRVARTMYEGPYGKLGAAWGEFREWLSDNGHATTEDLWEQYVSGPPSPLRTELMRPLR